MTEGDPLQGINFKSEVLSTQRDAEKLSPEQLPSFLHENFERAIALCDIGPSLRELKIERQHLMNTALLADLSLPGQITNGMVIDVVSYAKKHTAVNRRCVLSSLGADLCALPKFDSKLNTIHKRYKDMKKFPSSCYDE